MFAGEGFMFAGTFSQLRSTSNFPLTCQVGVLKSQTYHTFYQYSSSQFYSYFYVFDINVFLLPLLTSIYAFIDFNIFHFSLLYLLFYTSISTKNIAQFFTAWSFLSKKCANWLFLLTHVTEGFPLFPYGTKRMSTTSIIFCNVKVSAASVSLRTG